ncbi:MAG: hypothetical protein JW866_05000 [Ignavibacteriales bacterium]|nr:hypothetical protein [Ignavibacteriales bacterium]
MKKLYIHIGTYKTGTTTIQQGLALNERELMNHGYVYASTARTSGDNFNHHNLVHFLHNNKLFKETKGTWEELIFEIKNKEYENFIISSEIFCSMKKEEIEKIRDILPAEIRVIIVCYLRRQDLILQSVWSQLTKNNMNKMDFKPWLKAVNYKTEFTDYFLFLKKWEDVFYQENIKVRVLERDQLEDGNLFKDFLSVCGIKFEFDKLNPIPLLNESPSHKTLHAIRLFKKYYPKKLNLKQLRYFSNLIQKYAEKKNWNRYKLSLLNKKLSKKILSFYKESNELVAKKYFKRENLFLDGIEPSGIKDEKTSELLNFELIGLFFYLIGKEITNFLSNKLKSNS